MLGDGNAFTCWCCQRECYGERIPSGNVLICGPCDRLEPCPVVHKDLAPAPSPTEQTPPAPSPTSAVEDAGQPSEELGAGACALSELLDAADDAERIYGQSTFPEPCHCPRANMTGNVVHMPPCASYVQPSTFRAESDTSSLSRLATEGLELAARLRADALELEAWAARARAACGGER